jgi:hypothetical protein
MLIRGRLKRGASEDKYFFEIGGAISQGWISPGVRIEIPGDKIHC